MPLFGESYRDEAVSSPPLPPLLAVLLVLDDSLLPSHPQYSSLQVSAEPLRVQRGVEPRWAVHRSDRLRP